MKAYGGVDVQIHAFLTSVLVGGEPAASLPGHLTPGERAPGTNWIGGWVGSRTGLDDIEKRENVPLASNSDPLLVQPVDSRYTDCAISALWEYRRHW
jgi:hypothetical protein